MKGRKTGGRVRKNRDLKKITFTPSQAALEVYNKWPNKSQSLDLAIINFNENEQKHENRPK